MKVSLVTKLFSDREGILKNKHKYSFNILKWNKKQNYMRRVIFNMGRNESIT